ncbi:hypothetical protein MOMA_06571 [Moraxella macacae 0408225]|uniref:2-amino-4-hydroxy-6-hydroxymethyldihydropteridine diphosphokinase n=1 Tax=Moraxella macacae 0408225 TaxID=1230338 RepID=L2F580_9GAMM|nr:2-amino-4-hydroxy-6-hydroxymethyldihydropteridine diphosphokinase [Moraxella macacae]ELA08204.1 hypothetical protein MOMA_06571 [Moraxella macacae 0408225]
MSNTIGANFRVEQAIFSLATNVDRCYLQCAWTYFATLGNVVVSDVYQSAVLHMNENAYHNQMLWLGFTKPMLYQDLLNLSKVLEQQNKRQSFAKPHITLDIDIIAIKTQQSIDTQKDEKNQDFIQLQSNWYGIARRLPLADYDHVCYTDLCQKTPCCPNLLK